MNPGERNAMSTQQIWGRFQQRLLAAGGECHLVADLREASSIIAAHDALASKELIVSPAFSALPCWHALLPLLQQKGIRLREADSPTSVADAPAGLSHAELAVAETGSVLLAENALEGRVVSMLTLTHFVLVRAQDLVSMLDEITIPLQQFTRPGQDQRHYISLVTGPSRTAD